MQRLQHLLVWGQILLCSQAWKSCSKKQKLRTCRGCCVCWFGVKYFRVPRHESPVAKTRRQGLISGTFTRLVMLKTKKYLTPNDKCSNLCTSSAFVFATGLVRSRLIVCSVLNHTSPVTKTNAEDVQRLPHLLVWGQILLCSQAWKSCSQYKKTGADFRHLYKTCKQKNIWSQMTNAATSARPQHLFLQQDLYDQG